MQLIPEIFSCLILMLGTYIIIRLYKKKLNIVNNNDTQKHIPKEFITKIKKIEKSDNSKVLIISDVLTNEYDYDDNEFLKHRLLDIDDGTENDFVRWFISDYTNDRTLHVFVHTNGGLVDLSNFIMNTFINHKGRINIYVSQYAYSAGASIVMSGTNIYMKEYAFLGPTDPQITCRVDRSLGTSVVSVSVLNDIFKYKDPKDINDTLLLEAIDGRKVHQSNIDTFRRILKIKNLPKEHEDLLLNKFTSGENPHVTQYSVKELSEWGLPIETIFPEIIQEFINSYNKLI
jgi:hypothetical protein